MAGSVNKVILIGNLGKDPETRTMQNGGKVCSFSLATSESWKDKNSGERQEKTQWHNIVIWNENIVRVAESYLKKGSKVYLEGQLETRKYEKDGRDVYTTEVVLRPYRGELTMLDTRGAGESGGSFNDNGGNYGASFESAPSQARAAGASRPAAAKVDELEDEIPF
jgi:single-strand DNA-binding protein